MTRCQGIHGVRGNPGDVYKCQYLQMPAILYKYQVRGDTGSTGEGARDMVGRKRKRAPSKPPGKAPGRAERTDTSLETELETLLRRCSPGLEPPATDQQVITQVQLGEFTYVLTRMMNPAPLTQRQKQIARLVKKGLPNKAIATRLGISEATVSVHLQRIYRKLRLDSRTTLAQRYIF